MFRGRVGEGQPVALLHGAAGDRTTWRRAGYVDKRAEREQFLATDPKVGAADVKGFGDGEQVRVYLDVIRAQALLLVGAAEDPEGQAAKVASLLPAGRAVTPPDLGHVGAFLAREHALPHAPQTLRENLAY